MLSIIQLLRPHQWIKNTFVFAGLIFGHHWHQPVLVFHALLATIAFCLISSTVYIYNDIIDYPYDKLHPIKKHRPLTSDLISNRQAYLIGSILLISSFILAWVASPKVLLLIFIYLIMNIAYTHILKHIVIIDVFVIAAGFMLRILTGTIGIGIPASQWLMFCGLMLTLFLGFTKRRSENITFTSTADIHRKVLNEYQIAFLDKMISITAGCIIISYSLYTMSPDTIYIHGTANLIYTTPFVIYGIFRYIYLTHCASNQSGHDTAHDLLHDKHLLLAIISWLITIIWLIS